MQDKTTREKKTAATVYAQQLHFYCMQRTAVAAASELNAARNIFQQSVKQHEQKTQFLFQFNTKSM